MKEVRIQYLRNIEGEIQELWKEVGKKQYFICCLYEKREWCFVNDAPKGYCELERAVPDEWVFIICDDEGKELFRSGNADGNRTFPSFDSVYRAEWAKLKPEYPRVEFLGKKNWLGAFFTEEVRETVNRDPQKSGSCMELNFTDCWWSVIKTEVIGQFCWLGKACTFQRNTVKSDYSAATWYDYRAHMEKSGISSGQWNYIGWEPAEMEKAGVFCLKDRYLLVQTCDLGISYTFYTHGFETIDSGILKQPDWLLYQGVHSLISSVQPKDTSCVRVPFRQFCEEMEKTVRAHPKLRRDNRALEGQNCLFATHRADSLLLKYDGEICRIIGRIDEASYDFFDVGTMWIAEMQDGKAIEVFADEVNIARSPQEFEAYLESRGNT